MKLKPVDSYTFQAQSPLQCKDTVAFSVGDWLIAFHEHNNHVLRSKESMLYSFKIIGSLNGSGLVQVLRQMCDDTLTLDE